MRRWIVSGMTLALLASSTAALAAKQKASSDEEQFLIAAAQGDLAEVSLGKIASEHGGTAAVKQFGEKMVKEHSKALDDVKKVAKDLDVTLPKQASSEEQALGDQLGKLSGAEFDQKYMAAMVKDHTKDVKEFNKQATEAKNPEVKALAKKTAPVLETHLKLAKQVQSGLKKK